jgi:hypothetical protein
MLPFLLIAQMEPGTTNMIIGRGSLCLGASDATESGCLPTLSKTLIIKQSDQNAWKSCITVFSSNRQ